MPDGSLPNQKIVMTILQALDLIDVNEEDRPQLKDLEDDLSFYKDEVKFAAYENCRELAGKILDKWYSQRHHITTTYKHFSGQNDTQKQFENLIQSEKKRYRDENPDADEEEDEDEPKNKKKQKKEGMSNSSQSKLLQQQAFIIDSQKGSRGADTKQ